MQSGLYFKTILNEWRREKKRSPKPTLQDIQIVQEILLQRNARGFNIITVNSILTALAHLFSKKNVKKYQVSNELISQRKKTLDYQLQSLVKKHIGGCGPRAISNIIWSFANLFDSLKYFHKIEKDEKENKKDEKENKLEKCLFDAIYKNADKFNPQEIANTCWALATLGYTREDLKNVNLEECLFEAIYENANEFNPQEIANTCWALATFGYTRKDLKNLNLEECLFDAIYKNAKKFIPQNIVNTCWALATLGYTREDLKNVDLEECLFDAIDKNANEFNPQDITNTCWALATLGYTRKDLSKYSPNHLTRHPEGYCALARGDSELSGLPRPAKSGEAPNDDRMLTDLKNEKLEKRLFDAINKNADKFNPQNIVNTCWALTTLGYTRKDLDEQLEKRLFDAIDINANEFNPQEIANTCWALATLDYTRKDLEDEKLEKCLFDAINKNADKFNQQDIVNICWALARFGYNESDKKILSLVESLIKKLKKMNNVENAIQILLASYCFRVPLSKNLKNQCLDEVKKNPTTPSILQAEVVQNLKKTFTGLEFKEEKFIIGRHVDIFIPSKMLIIEVDGPGHDGRNDKFYDSLLEKAGYTIVRLDFTKHRGNISDKMINDEILAKKLDKRLKEKSNLKEKNSESKKNLIPLQKVSNVEEKSIKKSKKESMPKRGFFDNKSSDQTVDSNPKNYPQKIKKTVPTQESSSSFSQKNFFNNGKSQVKGQEWSELPPRPGDTNSWI